MNKGNQSYACMNMGIKEKDIKFAIMRWYYSQQITRESMNNEMDLSFKKENVKEIQIQINLSVHS